MRVFFLVALAAWLTGCTNTDKIPADIISRPKMENIMWQLMQSDEYVNKLLIKDSLKKSSIERMKLYQQVFELNATSLPEFKKSYRFYMAHPDITKVMFDSIAARAGRQRSDALKPKAIPPLKAAAKP